MRFAEIAAAVAAIVAIPVAMDIEKPTMSADQFIYEVRCVAYADVARANDDLGVLKMRLNAEAERQPETAARDAEAAVEAVAQRAVAARSPAELQQVRAERAEACAGSQMFAGADAGENV
jgi:hypothetical protein